MDASKSSMIGQECTHVRDLISGHVVAYLPFFKLKQSFFSVFDHEQSVKILKIKHKIKCALNGTLTRRDLIRLTPSLVLQQQLWVFYPFQPYGRVTQKVILVSGRLQHSCDLPCHV